MSQQGADDWWQKLYEDPDAGPEPDPGDTLDHRFRSAAVVVTPPAPGEPPPPLLPSQRHPEPPPEGRPDPLGAAGTAARPAEPGLHGATGAVPGARRPDPRPDLPPHLRPEAGGHLPPDPVADANPRPESVNGPRPGGSPDAVPGTAPGSPPRARSDRRPESGTGPGTGRGPDVAPGAVPGALPGARAGSVPGQGPGPALGRGPEAGPELRPGPPRDPRQAGPTGYALGDVTVPPAPAEPEEAPELPVWRWGVPRDGEAVQEVPPAAPGPPPAAEPVGAVGRRPEVRHLGDRAPTYAAEPGSLPVADPADLDRLVPDTVLEGARHGTYTLRAASVRGDSARYRGEARRDFLLTARFGTGDDALVLVALAGGDRAAPGAREAAAEVCHWVAAAIGRSQERLAADIRSGRRDALRSGLQRLTDRGYGRLRAHAAELGLAEEEYTAGLRGLLLPVDPECKTRVSFGTGAGGLFRLRAGQWQDLEPGRDPREPAPEDPAGGGFRFRASVARPGDTLLLCSGGLAEPMREEALLPAALGARWAEPEPPGLAAFLADTQLRLKGYADDRTAAAVWEA
ncbi:MULTISPECIES: protein phosphatase 2C domain-containing protein [unclassified Streptomyces]|uniref:protein phosphatase 2C domain-containing protein n=1 Tax=unclassified Streptomyces TaxID=2593676 RepID=UPI00225C2CE2|nr:MULTISPECIES: protein phosphatase 2C domain-containing protein [unclassified Streptomyces]MCX4528753.1 protein phosphatase 2C domain-containing protein [Streptomyces sp. NBC_01551]MCX4540639.1 protein phosphatase 2C domain-containing protein [Streptomyces sp. NBC_01565]